MPIMEIFSLSMSGNLNMNVKSNLLQSFETLPNGRYSFHANYMQTALL